MKPNVVFIMADDMGWGDPGFNNPESQVPTPNLERIAAQGVRLANAHAASSVCSPSRYALLTGRYAWRTRMKEGVLYGYCRHLIEPGRLTLGSLFKSLGYKTACVGKWHVGLDWSPKEGDAGDWGEGTVVRHTCSEIGHSVDFSRPIKNGPNSVGFDYFFGTAACSTCNEPYTFIENDRVAVRPEFMECPRRKQKVWRAPDWDDTKVDDIYVEKAIAFMDENSGDGNPFFLYLPLSAPHAPLWPPAHLEGRSNDHRRGDMVCWFDQSVGRIDEALTRLGLRENTLLIVTSDNGAQVNCRRGYSRQYLDANPEMTAEEMNEQGIMNADHRVSGPYRGYKTDIWDGGTRVAFIARWPGEIPPGSDSHGEYCLMDTLPSMAELLGAPLDEGQVEDGIARLKTLLGREGEKPREDLVTHSYTGVFALRKGPWKLIPDTLGSGGHRGVTPEWRFVEPDSPGQLYNLEQDPYERNNLWNDGHRELIIKLRAHLQRVQNRGL